jgi:hypothetical protein
MNLSKNHNDVHTHPVSSLKGREPENPGRDLTMEKGTAGFGRSMRRINWKHTHLK